MKINLENVSSLFSTSREWCYKNGKAILKKHIRISHISVAAVILVCAILTTALVYGAVKKDITISDIDGVKNISTFKNTVGDVLKEKNIELGNCDKLNVALTDKLKDGLRIEIKRANNISVAVDGKKLNLITTAASVSEVLKEAAITLGEKDKIEPALNTQIKPGTNIKVTRVTEKVLTEIKTIEFKNEIKKNNKFDKGLVHVVKKGENGKKEISLKVVYEDGKEVSRQIIGEKVLKNPVNGIIEEGTRTTVATSRGATLRFTKVIPMIATAYDSSYESTGKHPGHPQYGITRSGLRARPGIVAVDPKVIPLGTWLYVEGYGEALAADTGGAIKGNRIDLYFESSKDVNRYGKRKVKVYILDKPRYKF